MLSLRVWLPSTVLVLAFAAPVFAQEEAAPVEPPPAGEVDPLAGDAAPSPQRGSLEAKVARLDAELEALKRQLDGEEKKDETFFSGWQVQLRGSWHTLAHNHRNHVFKADDHQHGWGAGLGFMAPIWPDAGPVDLFAHLAIEYRQVAYSTVTRAPITNASVTINYLNLTIAPAVRLPLSDLIRPFVIMGINMQVASPPEDGIGYLDLGFVLGGGIDLAVHERISVGIEYKYTWFGVADQEEEDYGQVTGYVAFNF